jgi:DNA polymerase-1
MYKKHTDPVTSAVKDTAFVVDSNWYLHRIFHTTNYEARDPARNVSIRLLSMVCKDALAVRAKKVLVALDGNDVFRHKLYTDYKANRHKEGPSPYDHVDYLLEFFNDIGIPVAHLSAYEADDILCSAATQYDGPVVLGTRDKDMYQFMTPRIRMYNSSAKPDPVFVSLDDIESKFGVPSTLALDYQTLIGDGIDNIPSLMAPARAKKGLLLHGSFKAWWKADADLREELDPAEIRLNRKMVKLVSTLDVTPAKPKRSKMSNLPAQYHVWMDFIYPKTKSLF